MVWCKKKKKKQQQRTFRFRPRSGHIDFEVKLFWLKLNIKDKFRNLSEA